LFDKRFTRGFYSQSTSRFNSVDPHIFIDHGNDHTLSYSDDLGVSGSGIFYKEQGTHLAFKNNTGTDCRTTV
jgi:hypothetical protein